MNIVVVTSEEFPYGNAATNRVLTYLPGVVKLGNTATVLCLSLTREDNARLLDKDAKCNYQGITIRYMRGREVWPFGSKNYIKKIYLKLLGRIQPIWYLFKHRKTIDIVQMYSTDIELYERYSKWCKRFNLKYIIERSELPNIVKFKERYNHSAKGKKYIDRSEKAFGLFDGWILETQTLVDYYKQFFKLNTKYAIVPMTVEVERFSLEKSATSKYGRYIAYCGNMQEIDGVSILIKAFSIVHESFPEVKLVLAGTSDDVLKQKKLAESLGILDDVLFLGRISRDEVPQLLADATILALASPTSDRACASMPCKVGEYLCTGNPVVVTGLGEINKYLNDGESAYLSKPDSEVAFADKLIQVLSDIKTAHLIGEKGREVAIMNFGSDAQVKRIDSFYHEMLNK